jgi:hypothetical protein
MFGVNKVKFDSLCKLWNNKTFEDLKRDFHNKDGDAFNTVYSNDTLVTVKKVTSEIKTGTIWQRTGTIPQVLGTQDTTMSNTKIDTILKVFNYDMVVPTCVTKSYENRVRASKSLFNFEAVSKADVAKYDLKEYPANNLFGFVSLLGDSNKAAANLLRKNNALLGSKKKLQMFILVFKEQPLQAGLMQRSYWKGGNKNEFTLCIGTSKNKIIWTRVISWSDKEVLKARVARTVKEMDTLNLVNIVGYLSKELENNFEKKNFRDFDYISIEPTGSAILITYILVLLLSIGWAVYSVRNEVDL